MGMVVQRFEVWLISLDPTIGHEIKKTRPCLIISPDVMNRNISTVIVAPMTTKSRSYPSRVHCHFQGKDGYIILDQIRTVDKKRLIKRLGEIDTKAQENTLTLLMEIFAK